jgi:cbb3-type cytochrome c oxidase subunit III
MDRQTAQLAERNYHVAGRCMMKRMTMLLLLVAVAALVSGAVFAGSEVKNPFSGNATAIKEGEKIYDRLCVDCHLDGTGGSGPNLIDDTWIYGSSDEKVFETITKGRPGGMPSWGGELKEEEIWKVIAYVRSIKR